MQARRIRGGLEKPRSVWLGKRIMNMASARGAQRETAQHSAQLTPTTPPLCGPLPWTRHQPRRRGPTMRAYMPFPFSRP